MVAYKYDYDKDQKLIQRLEIQEQTSKQKQWSRRVNRYVQFNVFKSQADRCRFKLKEFTEEGKNLFQCTFTRLIRIHFIDNGLWTITITLFNEAQTAAGDEYAQDFYVGPESCLRPRPAFGQSKCFNRITNVYNYDFLR